MRFDSECDLAIEADSEVVRSTIRDLRTKLAAEHLGTSASHFGAALQRAGGSLLRAIEGLRGKSGVTLRPLEARQLNQQEIALAKSRLFDPEEPVKPRERLADFLARLARRNQIPITIAGTLIGDLAVRRLLARFRR